MILATRIKVCGSEQIPLTQSVQSGRPEHIFSSALGGKKHFSYESIQEFQVLQHRWTAEQGRAVGGVVNVITKSGSNDFHAVFAVRGDPTAIRALNPRGCTQADVNELRTGENLSLASRLAQSTATAPGAFLQPVSLYGPGFGPPVGRPLTAQLGLRFTF